mgnify:CR=1 FL=1
MLRIAMCDDETEAREALYLLLDQELHEESEQIVYEFSTGTAAANWLQKHPGEIDLLFLDVEMDGMNGMETAKKIRTFDQNLLIVFVTGFADYVFDGYSVGAMDYLMKPVSRGKLQSLLARVREKLGQEEAEEFAAFLAAEGAEQCGFCSPGFVMNVLAMVRELSDPTEEEIKEYLAGNLCRCTGYMGQLRAIKKYMSQKKENADMGKEGV